MVGAAATTSRKRKHSHRVTTKESGFEGADECLQILEGCSHKIFKNKSLIYEQIDEKEIMRRTKESASGPPSSAPGGESSLAQKTMQPTLFLLNKHRHLMSLWFFKVFLRRNLSTYVRNNRSPRYDTRGVGQRHSGRSFVRFSARPAPSERA